MNRKRPFAKSLPLRAWFYFRMGWATYFAFIFAAVNTMVVTYYLAIENIPALQTVFPSFAVYAIIMIIIGIPILVFTGYLHYKRTRAFGSEQDVIVESNPYMYKLLPGHQKEVFTPLQLALSKMILKMATNEKPTEEDIQELKELMKKIDDLLKGGSVGGKI